MAKTEVPEIPGPVWEEHSRTITVQAYKVVESERVITVDGVQNVGPGNYIVNEGGFISIVDAASFAGLYGVDLEELPVEDTEVPETPAV